MSKLYRSREGNVTAVDTKTQLTTLASQTVPGALLVPGAASHLAELVVIAVSDFAAAADACFLVRLEGPGLKDGPVSFTVGAAGAQVATGGQGTIPAVKIPVGVVVDPNQEVLVFAEMVGEDMGTATVGVTLVFSDSAGEGGETLGTLTVEGDVNAIDTEVQLTAQGSVTAPSRVTPPDSSVIKRVIVAGAADGAAAGNAAMLLRFGGTAVKNGEQTLFVAGHSAQTVQAGSDGTPSIMAPVIFDDIDIEINPSESLDISAEHAGVDVGDTTIAVTVVYA